MKVGMQDLQRDIEPGADSCGQDQRQRLQDVQAYVDLRMSRRGALVACAGVSKLAVRNLTIGGSGGLQ